MCLCLRCFSLLFSEFEWEPSESEVDECCLLDFQVLLPSGNEAFAEDFAVGLTLV